MWVKCGVFRLFQIFTRIVSNWFLKVYIWGLLGMMLGHFRGFHCWLGDKPLQKKRNKTIIHSLPQPTESRPLIITLSIALPQLTFFQRHQHRFLKVPEQVCHEWNKDRVTVVSYNGGVRSTVEAQTHPRVRNLFFQMTTSTRPTLIDWSLARIYIYM